MNSKKLKYMPAFILLFPLFAIAQNDSIDIYNQNLIELSHLTVSSVSKTPQNFEDIPATMRIVTGEEIKENGYFTLEEALSGLPGFQFRNTLGYNSYVFQRGIPSQNNLIIVLIDGVQINELNSGGFYSGGHFNLDNIERIEIVYGPVSVIYGTNAVSGVINIITKSSTGLSASLLTGNFNTFNSTLNYGYKKNGFGVKVSGMFKTSEKVNLRGEENDNRWTEEMENYEDDYSFDTKIWYRNLIAGVNYQNRQSSASTFYPSVGTIYKDQGSLWNILFVNGYIKYKHIFSDKISLSSNIYNRNATVRDNTIFRVEDNDQVGFYRPNHLFGMEGVLNYSPGNQLKIISGIMFESERIAEGFSVTHSNSAYEAPPTPQKPKMLKNDLLSLFVETEYKIIKELAAVGGLRFDNSSAYDQVLTPRFSLIFNNNWLNSKLLYAEAFRAPKPWDYTNGLGNPDLEPEQMMSFEFSNRINLSKSMILSVALYKNILDQSIVKEVLGAGDNYKWVNRGKIETKGTEISTQYWGKRMKLDVNYTYNSSYDEEKEIIPEIAKHSANTSFTYHIWKHFRINLRAHYLGKRKNPQLIVTTNSNYTKPALIFHGTLSLINSNNTDIQLIAKNIFNKEYYHTSNRLVDRYRQPQRTIMLKITYNFIK